MGLDFIFAEALISSDSVWYDIVIVLAIGLIFSIAVIKFLNVSHHKKLGLRVLRQLVEVIESDAETHDVSEMVIDLPEYLEILSKPSEVDELIRLIDEVAQKLTIVIVGLLSKGVLKDNVWLAKVISNVSATKIINKFVKWLLQQWVTESNSDTLFSIEFVSLICRLSRAIKTDLEIKEKENLK